MAANGPHVNHEGEVINITGRGLNDADEDDDDARSISPITIGTEWNPKPSPRKHHYHGDTDSAKILGEDSYGMNPALGVNVVVPDKSSRKKRGKSRDRLAAAAGRVGKEAVAAGGAGAAKQGRRGSSSAHPLWGASGAVAAVTAANYMAGVTGRRSSVDRSAAIDAKMAARESARQEKGAGVKSAADIAKASVAAKSRDREKDREASELLSMSRNNASASTFGDTAANGFVSVHRRSSDEPYVPKERHEVTNNRRRRDDGSSSRKPSDKMKTQGNNSISVSGFADMFNIQGKQSSGSTGRSGSRRTAGTGTDYSSFRDDVNDDSSTLFGDAGTFADVKPPPEAPAKPAPVKPASFEPKRGSIAAPTATASARAAPAEMQHTGNASRSSFNSFASFTPSKFGGPPVGGGKTTGLNDSYVTELNDAQGGKEYRSGNVSSGSLGSKGSGKYMAKSDDAIVNEGSGDSNGPSPAQSSTTLGRQLNALSAQETAPKAAGIHIYNKRRSGETDYATVHDRRRSSSDSSALDRRIEEVLEEEEEGEDSKLASAIGRALDARERSREATDSGDAGSSANLPIVKEEYREYRTELAPLATEGPNQSGASASKHSLRRGSGGSGGEESRGSLSMAMEALGLDRSNSDQMRANEAEDGGIPDGEGRRAATRPGAVYEHTPAPEAYHYQTLSRPPANARSRGISSGSNNPTSRSRADVLRDMEQQEQERMSQRDVGTGNAEGRPRPLSEDVDLEAVLRLSAEGGASDSEAARFLEEQRAAMERFEASQRAPTTNASSFDDNVDSNIASNEYPSSTDGINTEMTTAGGGPNRPLIEISPGRFEFLRGSEETWNAIKRGNYASVMCEACQADLRCVADADMVVCPDCRCVSPLDGRAMPSDAGGFSEGGVGLGVLVRDLAPAVQRRLGVHT